MKTRIFLKAFLLLSLMARAQDPCEKLLQDGLYQKINITTKSSFNQDLRTYFLSEDFKQDVKKGSWGADISIPIEGVPFSLGANSSDEHFSQFRSRIQSSSSLNISLDDFVSISRQLPNSSLYEAFVECQRINNDQLRKGLIQGKKIETEETVTFPLYFRQASPNEKAPKVKTFTVEPKSALIDNGGIKVGKRLPSYYMAVVVRRSEINDIVFNLQTDYGNVGGSSAPTKSSRFETPVGTIIISYLPFDRFRDAIGETGTWRMTNKWAPCDGTVLACIFYYSL